MIVAAFDLETRRFGPANMAPKPVCLSYALGDESGLMVNADIVREFGPLLEAAARGKVKLIGHRVAFDMTCLAAWHPELRAWIWEAYVRGSIECTSVREKLLDIADGSLRGEFKAGATDITWVSHGYALDNLAGRWLDRKLDKGADSWRVNYQDLEDVPLELWPKRAVDYAIGDSTTCLEMYHVQHARSVQMRYPLNDSANQARSDFSLRLASVWGLRTDLAKLVKAWDALEKKVIEYQKELAKLDLFDIDKGSKKVKNFQALIASIVDKPKRTEKGAIKTDEDTLQDIDHPITDIWVKMGGAQKTRGYLKRMFKGVTKPLHTNFDVLVYTGRCSSSGPGKRRKGMLEPVPGMNIQNFPREPGVRECIVAREGYVFLNADYDSQEMRTLAQACVSIVGRSVLADRYRDDRFFDPHTMFAGQMRGIEYEDAMKLKAADDESMLAARQSCKIANFGLPGGMGERGLVAYARGYTDPVTDEPFRLTLHDAKKLKAWWFRTWPEMVDYFKHIRLCVGSANAGTITLPVSGRRRGLCGYTDGANTLFQGGASDISKAMFFEISRRCYSVRNSALYGSRPCNFIHDEAMLESPEARAPDAAVETIELMVEIMERYTPDVPSAASATLSRFWSKKAKRIVDNNGRLQVWEG